jgi:hypothetical protein
MSPPAREMLGWRVRTRGGYWIDERAKPVLVPPSPVDRHEAERRAEGLSIIMVAVYRRRKAPPVTALTDEQREAVREWRDLVSADYAARIADQIDPGGRNTGASYSSSAARLLRAFARKA